MQIHPLSASDQVALVELVLELHKELLLVQVGQTALMQIAQEAGIEDVEARFQRHSSSLMQQGVPTAAFAQVRQLESMLQAMKKGPSSVN